MAVSRFPLIRKRPVSGPVGAPPETKYVETKIPGDDDPWIRAQLGKMFPADNFPHEVVYSAPGPLPPHPKRASHGTRGASSEADNSFVYLDVGAWFGSRDGAWAKQGSFRRDFGLVCGPHVLLCAFVDANGHSPDEKLRGVTEDAEWAVAPKDKGVIRLREILAQLATGSGQEETPGSLGKPIVVRYLSARGGGDGHWGADSEKWRVYVIVGDMHMAVVDATWSAHKEEVDAPPIHLDSAICIDHRPSHTHPTHSPTIVNTHLNEPRVCRFGRVDILPLEKMVSEAVPDLSLIHI